MYEPKKGFLNFKNSVLTILLIVILGWIFLALIYPFSVFSIGRVFDYKPDSVAIKQFNVNFSKAEKRFKNSKNNDNTANLVSRTYEILKSEPWILSKNEQNISVVKLIELEQRIHKVRQEFISLRTNQYNLYDHNEMDLLEVLIGNLESIETHLEDITLYKYRTKNKLSLSLHNLNNNFMGLCNSTDSFYEEYLR